MMEEDCQAVQLLELAVVLALALSVALTYADCWSGCVKDQLSAEDEEGDAL